MPTKHEDKIPLGIRFEPELKEMLDAAAKLTGLTRTRIVEDAIRDYLATPMSERIRARECNVAMEHEQPPPAAVSSPAKPALADERAAKAGRKVAAALRARKPSTGEPTA